MSRRDRYTFGDDAELEDFDDFYVRAEWVADVWALLHPRCERDVQLSLWEECS